MARRKKRSRSRQKPPALWPKLLGLIVACLLVGGVLAWMNDFNAPAMPSLPAGDVVTSMPGHARDLSDADGDPVERMTRAELEREVRRLRDQLAEREAEVADLSIRLKLAESAH